MPGPNLARSLRLSYKATTPATGVPIYVAASGERTQRMSGRVADGALLSGIPDELSASIRAVRAGEQEAGRASGATRILLWTTVGVGDDRDAARAAVRGSVARRALNTLGRFVHRGDLEPDDRRALERLQREHDRGHLLEVDYSHLVPEHWIDRFAIAGTPGDVRTRLERAVHDGAEEISIILMGPRPGDRSAHDQLSYFAENVMAPMRRAAQATKI